ncbi:hypothetical protein [Massilia sp. 9I]|uniref:hypothetical protein n=1 Tax=Massilia sp. 9I TaxID=2653152 RepID=UPI0012F1C1C4|nr:hypothetical protein [Massilia sp. 9I]VXC41777.1 conserved exported hypothetical protein [Massilia sp. 9I]
MNVLKNMEAIFVVALALAGVSTYAEAAIGRAADAGNAQVSVSASQVAVVKVSAKRPA